MTGRKPHQHPASIAELRRVVEHGHALTSVEAKWLLEQHDRLAGAAQTTPLAVRPHLSRHLRGLAVDVAYTGAHAQVMLACADDLDRAVETLERFWVAFGCELPPDRFKPSVRQDMLKQALDMARESTSNSGRIAREAQQAQAAIARVKVLHRMINVEQLAWECYQRDCKHEDECPNEGITVVCEECTDSATWERDPDEYEPTLWPCATIRALEGEER